MCSKCGINDHFRTVCLANGQAPQWRESPPLSHRCTRTPNYESGNWENSQKHDEAVHHLLFSDDGPTDFAFYPDDFQEHCYYLETQDIHSITTQLPKKRYFVKLPLSATGSSIITVTLQIDTQPCATLSLSWHPQHPGPKGTNVKVTLPMGTHAHWNPQAKNNKYETLTFQIPPDDIMGNTLALLSGGDCEQLGCVKIEAENVSSLSVRSNHCNRSCDVQTSAQDSHIWTTAECNQLRKLRNNSLGASLLFLSQLIRIPVTRRPTPAGKLHKEHILAGYAANFEDPGCLGLPVHVSVKPGITPFEMPIHCISVAKRAIEKSGQVDKYKKIKACIEWNNPGNTEESKNLHWSQPDSKQSNHPSTFSNAIP